MSNWYDSKLDEFADKVGLKGSEYNELEKLIAHIVEGEREDAISEMEYPPISEFVADNFARDILNEMEYSDIAEYVADCESTKESDDYDYRSTRGV